MKKIFILCFLLCSMVFAAERPINSNSFYSSNDTVTVEGILEYTGNNETIKSYTKSINYNCNLTNKQCEMLEATYVDNGKNLRPSLYPRKENCEILHRDNRKIITLCQNGFISLINFKTKTFTFEKDDIKYLLKWDQFSNSKP